MLNGKPATRTFFATTTVVNEVELVGEQLRAPCANNHPAAQDARRRSAW